MVWNKDPQMGVPGWTAEYCEMPAAICLRSSDRNVVHWVTKVPLVNIPLEEETRGLEPSFSLSLVSDEGVLAVVAVADLVNSLTRHLRLTIKYV